MIEIASTHRVNLSWTVLLICIPCLLLECWLILVPPVKQQFTSELPIHLSPTSIQKLGFLSANIYAKEEAVLWNSVGTVCWNNVGTVTAETP